MDPISSIVSLVTSIVSRVWPDKTEVQKQQFALELAKEMNQQQLLTKQIDVNIEEAKSSNLFVAGGRPFVIWICGLSFAWQFLVQPIIVFIGAAAGHPILNLPVFDYNSLNTVLMGLLGLGAMRSYDKKQELKK